METTTKRKCLSYIRFSSAQQGELGRHSTQRQQDALEDACTKWNLELDGTFKDEGKSGYHQKHLAKGGAMYQLREMAKRGELRGRVLCVEDWDRTGRMSVTDAAPLLLDILNNGCDMVVGQDGGEYFSKHTVDENPFLFYKALDTMNRGKGESVRKTNMAKKKWQARLEAVARGEKVPLNNLPFWLLNEKNQFGKCTGGYVIRDGMKKLIADIFSMYLNGDGGQIIARKLNANLKMYPVPTRADGTRRKNANVWHSTIINKIIRSRSVLGYYNGTEHKVLPAMIDEETFKQANYKRVALVHTAGRKAKHVNPFSGLLICAHCGGHLSRHSSRAKQGTAGKYVYLQCRTSKLGKCSAAGILYWRFEESFITLLSTIDNISQEKVEVLSKAKEIRIKISETEGQITTLKKALTNLPDPSKAVSVVEMLTGYDMKKDTLLKELEVETAKEAGQKGVNSAKDLEFIKSLYSKNKIDDEATRMKIKEALRRSLDMVKVDVKTQSYTVHWKGSKSVGKVELTKDGYKIGGKGIIVGEIDGTEMAFISDPFGE